MHKDTFAEIETKARDASQIKNDLLDRHPDAWKAITMIALLYEVAL